VLRRRGIRRGIQRVELRVEQFVQQFVDQFVIAVVAIDFFERLDLVAVGEFVDLQPINVLKRDLVEQFVGDVVQQQRDEQLVGHVVQQLVGHVVQLVIIVADQQFLVEFVLVELLPFEQFGVTRPAA